MDATGGEESTQFGSRCQFRRQGKAPFGGQGAGPRLQTPMSSEQGDFVNSVSNLLHNLPGQLEKATTEEEYDEILRQLGPISRPIAAECLHATLENLGVDPSSLT